MSKFRLNSSDGRTEVEFDVQSRFTSDSNIECFLSVVEVTEQFWEIEFRISESDLHEEVYLRLPQMAVGREALRTMFQSLREWLASPFYFDCCLANERDQKLTISFHRDENLISTVDRPICSVNYEFGLRHCGKFSFAVDQSCMQILHDDIGAIFAN